MDLLRNSNIRYWGILVEGGHFGKKRGCLEQKWQNKVLSWPFFKRKEIQGKNKARMPILFCFVCKKKDQKTHRRSVK